MLLTLIRHQIILRKISQPDLELCDKSSDIGTITALLWTQLHSTNGLGGARTFWESGTER